MQTFTSTSWTARVHMHLVASSEPSDSDTTYDMYDAHSCGVDASWACASQAPVTIAPCESASACKASVIPASGELSVLASEALEGVGNLVAKAGATKARVKKCSRSKRRRDGKCVKVAEKKAKRRLRDTHGKLK